MGFRWGLCFVLFAQSLLFANTQIIVLLGKPGAGKGTYAIKLREDFHIPQISTGELLKENIRKGMPLGVLAKSCIESGTLVPDQFIVEMFLNHYQKQNYRECILDGFPRTLQQAKLLDEKLGSLARITVIYLKTSDEVATNRILGRMMCEKCYATYNIPSVPPKTPGVCDFCHTPLYHRQDDNAQVVKTRLSVFQENTAPLVSYYRKQHRLHEIDSNQPIETIYRSILGILRKENPYRKTHFPRETNGNRLPLRISTKRGPEKRTALLAPHAYCFKSIAKAKFLNCFSLEKVSWKP